VSLGETQSPNKVHYPHPMVELGPGSSGNGLGARKFLSPYPERKNIWPGAQPTLTLYPGLISQPDTTLAIEKMSLCLRMRDSFDEKLSVGRTLPCRPGRCPPPCPAPCPVRTTQLEPPRRVQQRACRAVSSSTSIPFSFLVVVPSSFRLGTLHAEPQQSAKVPHRPIPALPNPNFLLDAIV
jgi:hypothetical protein